MKKIIEVDRNDLELEQYNFDLHNSYHIMNDFNEECENCCRYNCRRNGNNCNNCEKCSVDNCEKSSKYQNDKWKMNCLDYKE